jgi:hypothetical protein
MIRNLGTAFVIFGLTCTFIVVIILLKKVASKVPYVNRAVDHFHKLLVFNSGIRFMIEAYLDLSLTSFVNVHYILWKYSGDIVSSIFALGFSVTLMV